MIRPRRDLIIGTGWIVHHRAAHTTERSVGVWAGPVLLRLGRRPSARWIGWRRAEWRIRKLLSVPYHGPAPLDLRAVYEAPFLTVDQAAARILALAL
jgi:hypothetical protein